MNLLQAQVFAVLVFVLVCLASIFLAGCAPPTQPQTAKLARTELHDTVDASVQCEPGLVATRATVRFFMNGDPKSLEMECSK